MPFTSKKVLILGATGLIGSAFTRYFDREKCAERLTPSREELDLTHFDSVANYMRKEKPDLVLFCAGKVGGILANLKFPYDYFIENLVMETNVFRSVIESDISTCVYLGSSCMYPKWVEQPIREEALGTGRPNESSLSYAMAKKAGVELCLSYQRQYGIRRFLVGICNNVYGPGGHFDKELSHLVPALIQRFHEAKKQNLSRISLWGTGLARREFVYVDDVVSAVTFLLTRDDWDGKTPINIGSGECYQISEWAEKIARVVGYHGQISFYGEGPEGVMEKKLDLTKLTQRGWSPKVTAEEGLRVTYDWLLTHEN